MAGTLPTLTLIDAWDTQHLEAATDHWTSRARAWEDAYTAVYHETPIPGGIPWEGRAVDAALRHVGADLSVTDQLGPAPRRVRAVREYPGKKCLPGPTSLLLPVELPTGRRPHQGQPL